MADILLQKNDEAYARVEHVVEQIAQRLEFEYITWDPPPRAGPGDYFTRGSVVAMLPLDVFGRLTRASPHVFGLFAVQNSVRLECRTRLRMELFEEHIKERLVLENIGVDRETGMIEIIDEQLARIGLALPNGLDLVLSHKRVDDALPEELSSFSRFVENSKEPLALQCLSTIYRRNYLLVRDWAYRVGIMSPDGRIGTEEVLVKYYTEGFFEHIQDVERLASSPVNENKLFYKIIRSNSFCQLPRHMCHVPLSDGRYMSQMSSDHRMRMKKAIERVAPPSDLADWTVDALKDFVATYEVFIKIDASCWDVRHQSKLAQHRFISETRYRVARFEALHVVHFGREFQLTAYPEFSLPTGHLDNITFLIAASAESPSRSFQDVYDHAVEISRTTLNPRDFEGVGRTVQYEVMDRQALTKALGDLEVIAHNLPAVFALHLDYSPLIDPLAEEEAKNKQTALTSTSPAQEPSDKFRTSQEVLNRLQWDTKHASNRYEVGYKDRFETKLLWKPLEEWTKDKQAEDFVPIHRIHQFREVGSTEVIWDRDKRVDRTG
ncbi:hypothetical protein M409DRAFT_25902 [Zasmidium cellare ATCC 36951]|uniref:MJ1316 RNA cyclic group end recognition domain-containing protein n=1 Tax=Zasmidium cellare ATCC 36951 TaxID=1080233 RepID=A0A6A6CE66_ZASCE|nr:uncharacterized protein M409DRAFT_25902 [Zasmidium cellare ATCC 36951]KAF2163716.1 hypothetical protein M409DRAFT_25902 [Zasmidium cellare ATCC 36951]